MGLSGPRKRQKISHDPNNIHWSSNTKTFGQRILASQGWTPGQTLGPQNASHARHFTKASASHVRVVLRDDNLGLGAKPGSGQGPGECTGLDSFQDLLGRLNGKSEAVIEKERSGRANVNRMLYAERKYGGWSRFVSAGYLVGGESMQNQLDTTLSVSSRPGRSVEVNELEDSTSIHSKRSKEKKKRHDKDNTETEPRESIAEDAQHDTDRETRKGEEKAQRRAEKAQRKENRRKRREEKAARKGNKIQSTESERAADSSEITTSVTPSGSTTNGSATPTFAGGRHAVRQRYIMQKKAAMLDAKALNEILMVKV